MFVLEGAIDGTFYRVGDEIVVHNESNKRIVCYISRIVLDKKDKVKEIYAMNTDLTEVICLNDYVHAFTGGSSKEVLKLARTLAGVAA